MSQPIAADYGFTKTENGNETTFVIHESEALKSSAKLRKILWNGLLVFFGLLVWGGSGNILAGVIVFAVLKYGFKFLGKLLGAAFKVKTNLGNIVVRPTTVSVGDKSYALKDVRDWWIGNPRQNVIAPVTVTNMVADHAARSHWFIKFHYGAQEITAAINLSEAQANALLNEVLATIQRQGEGAAQGATAHA